MAGSLPPCAHSRKRQLRVKQKLDVAPVPQSLTALHDNKIARHQSDTPEAVLAANIEAVQHDRKSFKEESWNHSPTGAGSKSSVLLSAFKQQDCHDTGYLLRAQILATLQHHPFELSEAAIRTLLVRYDPREDRIHYKTFVQHLHFGEQPRLPNDQDITFRHERYLEKIHDHATRQLESCGCSYGEKATGLTSPLRLSPLVKTSQGMIANNEPSIVLRNPPSRQLAPITDGDSPPIPSPTRYKVGDDPLSFVHDKQRRAQRAQAKASTLLAHITRMDTSARYQDVATAQHDSQRIAHKAIHYGEHLTRRSDEQQWQLYRHEHQGKANDDVTLTTAQHSVSNNSMLYGELKKHGRGVEGAVYRAVKSRDRVQGAAVEKTVIDKQTVPTPSSAVPQPLVPPPLGSST